MERVWPARSHHDATRIRAAARSRVRVPAALPCAARLRYGERMSSAPLFSTLTPPGRLRRLFVPAMFVLIVMAARPSAARAQTEPAPPPPRHEGSAEFSFVGTSGNASTTTVGVGGEFVYRPAPWETKIKVAYVRTQAERDLTAESLDVAARAQRPLRDRVGGFAAYGYQRDRFAGIVGRHGVEAGLSLTAFQQTRQKLVVDASGGYTHEARLLGDNLSSATAGAGFRYQLAVSATSEIVQDGRFQFSLDDGDDWRYRNTLALTARINSVCSLKVSNEVRYVNAPVDGFETTDVVTSIALVAKF